MRLLICALAALSLHAQSLSLKKQAWSMMADNSIKLGNYGNGALGFDFPTPGKASTPGAIHYLFTSRTGPMAGHTAISITLQVTGTAGSIFGYNTDASNTCVYPANVRAYFASNGVDLGGEFSYWWSNPVSYQMGPGTLTLTIPLTPSSWSSVFGKFGSYDSTTTAMFQEALQTVQNVGLSFGGGCFFANGVYLANGSGQFGVLNYTIQ